MRLGFRHTAFQAVCTVLVLCFALGLLERADTVQPVFGEDSVRVPILMYHSILKDSARQGKYVISPAVLAADLDALQEKGVYRRNGERSAGVCTGRRRPAGEAGDAHLR